MKLRNWWMPFVYAGLALLFCAPVQGANYLDDFSTDTTGNYGVTLTWPNNNPGQFVYDGVGERGQVQAGDNVGLAFTHDVTPSDSGSFRLDFLPTQKFPSGGRIFLRLHQDAGTYYEVYHSDGYGPGGLTKYVGGAPVESVSFSQEYSQGVTYTIIVDFSPGLTRVSGLGPDLIINSTSDPVTVTSFTVENSQQYAYYDNIVYTVGAVGNYPPIATDDTAVTLVDAAVLMNVLNNDSDLDGVLVPSTVQIVGPASNGTPSANADGTILYSPDAGYEGGDSFTYTVEDDAGEVSNEATVSVTISSATGPLSDDFSTDTTGNYGVALTWPNNNPGQFVYDGVGERAQVQAGDNVGLAFSHDLTPSDSGSFRLDFLPTQKFPAGGRFHLRLHQNAGTYYEVYHSDGYGPGGITKYVGGVAVDSASFTQGYSQGVNYTIIVDFSPGLTRVNGFGTELLLNSNNDSITVTSFTVENSQQYAYYDNIVYTVGAVGNYPPIATDDTAVTLVDAAVLINVLNNDSDLDGVLVPSTVQIVGPASNGTPWANADGTILYSPDAGYEGGDSFTYTVEDDAGEVSNEATVSVTISSATGPLSDDFSTDTTGNYGVALTWPNNNPGQFVYDGVGERAQVQAGDNVGLAFSHDLTPSDSGSFRLDFLPTQKFPAGGRFHLRLHQNAGTYYEVYHSDGYGPGGITKYVGGVAVDSASFTQGYSQGVNYTIIVDFSPGLTRVNGFGTELLLNSNNDSITVTSFTVENSQQYAYYDNIVYTVGAVGNYPPIATDDTAVTLVDAAVLINVLNNDSDLDGVLVPSTVQIVGPASNGTPWANTDGTILYSPDAGYEGGDSFTYTVEDDAGEVSNEATVTVTVSAETGLFSDDFSTDTTGNYTVIDTWTSGGSGQFVYVENGQRAQLVTGDNIGLAISHDLSPSDSGSFRLDFLPTQQFPTGGRFYLRLHQDANTYYEVYNSDGYGPGGLTKYVGGAPIESVSFSQEYSQGVTYTIIVDFSPGLTRVNGFGQDLIINNTSNSVTVTSFSVELSQQHAYFDNIQQGATEPYVVLMQPKTDSLQEDVDLFVSAVAGNLDAGWAIKFVVDEGTPSEQSFIDDTEPFETDFFGLDLQEHQVDCFVVDAGFQEVVGDFTRSTAFNVGIGDYYVLIGDSITFGLKDDDASNDVSDDGRNSGGGFGPILNNLMTGLMGYPHTMVNEGVPGARSIDGVNSIATVLAKHPGAGHYLVMYGTNDSSSFLGPVDSGYGLEQGEEGYAGSFKDHMQQIVDAINLAGAKAYLAKLPIALGDFVSGDTYPDPDQGDRSLVIQDYNLVINELVNDSNNNLSLFVPDFYADFLLNQRYLTEYADNLHPNGAGYSTMAQSWSVELVK